MQRGVITLTKPEVKEIVDRVDLDRFQTTPLTNKLSAALKAEGDGLNIDIEVSEEELEFILDEIVIPHENDTEATNSLRAKIHNMLDKFREGTHGLI